MTEKESFQTQSAGNLSDSDKSQKQVPYEGIVSQVVTKIKNEPFLFVIAVAALLIGLVVLAVGLGSPDLRFIVVVIALLAFVVILGYYIQAVLQMRARTQRETWRHEERLREASQTQAPSAGEAEPGTAEGRDVPTPASAPKYDIHMPGATGVAIGDGAKVEQHFESPGQPLAPGAPTAGAFTPEEQRTALGQELAQHRRNLARLRAKKAVYAAGEEPLSLLNQIEAEEREMQRIQAELEQLTAD